MNKRSFFKSIMGVVATLALAPELAFGRLNLPKAEPEQTQAMRLIMSWNDGNFIVETTEHTTTAEMLARKDRAIELNGKPQGWMIQCRTETQAKDDVNSYAEFQRLRKEAGL